MSNHKQDECYPKAEMPHPHPVFLLKGQKAIVTGGSRGIGRGVAESLGRAGAEVMVNYRKGEEEAEEVCQAIHEAGGKALTHQADVSDEEQVKKMVERAVEEMGALDILVANAGMQRDAAFEDMSLDDWQRVIDVNLTGQFLCCREAIRAYKKQGVRKAVSCAAGKIICMSSVHEVIPWAGRINYAASKGGIMLLMKTIAQEYASKKIRANSLAPGAIKTDINKEAWEKPEAEQKLLELIPSKRVGEPVDIGRAAVWLASDESEYVNGTTIFVDGGMTLYPGFTSGG